MRKAQKEQATKLVAAISQVHEEVKKYLELHNTTMALDLLAQCQQGAIELGGFIEKFEGEGCATVRVLEEYCEYVYNTHEEISQAISSNQTVNENKIYKNLRKRLIQIENSIKNEIPERKEVAFFPYKASMWDSLESVYLAAREDPNCDAYCVPIPYYDLKPDRGFGEMHYEGGQYPKNIEITDWQTYNFEERNPDEIYIHNPYDDWNLVTSVHPRFYSKNLKEHTEKLIYIPYFVLGEIEPDNQQAIDGMKHFIWLPGVINADKVIVQSEKMKQIYVNEYLKAAQTNGLGGNHLNRSYLEQKILGLGSPKFDKVNNTKKDDLEIPEDWLKIIEKPDGSWKKIIFYNTSVGALLSNSEKMLDKMRYVFGVFKEKQDEVALLWRPHPLIENTVKSMRPQLWEQYKALVDKYKQEGWGIYDDSSDMDRAVILSDGYYGDGSSIVQLYQQTGKPIRMQNVNYGGEFVLIEKNMANIFQMYLPYMIYTVRYDNNLYCMASNFNAICSIDLSNGKAKLISRLKGEVTSGDLLGNANIYENNLIICPFNFLNIHIWNISENKEIGVLGLDKAKGIPKVCIYNSKGYFIPSIGSEICILNLNNWTIEKKININKIYSKQFDCNYNVLSIDKGYVYNNKLYFSLYEKPFVAEYDLKTSNVRFYDALITDGFIQSVGYDDCLYLLGADGNIYVWNITNKKVEEKYKIEHTESYDITEAQNNIVVDNDIYYLTARCEWYVKYSINYNTSHIGEYSELLDIEFVENEKFSYSSIDDEQNVYFISNKNRLAILNILSNKVRVLDVVFDKEQVEDFWTYRENSTKVQSIGNKIYEWEL